MPAMKPNALASDPNVKIPAAVKAHAARAEQLLQEAHPAAPDSPPPATPEAPPPELPTPEVPPAPAAEVTPKGNEDWEQKYKSVKGRHDKQATQIAALSAEVTNLQRLLSTTQSAPAALPPSQGERLVTADEERDYGTELLDVVGRRAEEKFRPVILGMEAQIKALQAQLGQVGVSVAFDAKQRMISTLDANVKDWTKLNEDPDFLGWLALPDTFSGVIRHELLKAAWERHDTPRVLAFFNGFLAEEAAEAPTPRVQDPPPAQPAGRVTLKELAAPGRAKSAAGDAPPAEKPSFTRAQISQFYADVTNGKYRGRDDDKNRIETQIFEAQREPGRIR